MTACNLGLQVKDETLLHALTTRSIETVGEQIVSEEFVRPPI